MAKIKITIHNGKITTEAEGYRGSACQTPLNGLLQALGGNVDNEAITAEGALPDEPVCVDLQDELHA
jgi:hypothetical protein